MDETETITLPVKYFVDAEIDEVTGPQRFGPLPKEKAENLLAVLAGRQNVTKATLVREVQS